MSLARQASEASMVLLKNEGPVLPLDRARVKTIAVIGALGDTANTGDHGSSLVHPPYVVTPVEGIRQLLGGSVQVRFSDGKRLDEASKLAAEAGALILVVGYTHRDEGEYIEYGPISWGGDRRDLRLHDRDVALIQALAPLNRNTIVVLMGGSAIMMEEWKGSVPAILHAFYPGMEGGTALARVLFGEVNPSGKLPFSIPTNEGHLPAFDRTAERVEYDLYHGYTKLEKEGNEPAFAFGFGLSYTTFALSDPRFAARDGQLLATVRVTNSGDRFGAEVIQLYVGFDNSAVDRPRKLLRGFKKVTLAPGEAREVEIACPVDSLRWYNPETRAWELEQMVYQAYIGTSSQSSSLLEGIFSL